MRGEFPAACATILVLLTAAGCGETRTPGGPTPLSVRRPDGTAPAASQAGRVVVADTAATLGDDDYVLNGATITGDTLAISVSYSGSAKGQARIKLRHYPRRPEQPADRPADDGAEHRGGGERRQHPQ